MRNAQKATSIPPTRINLVTPGARRRSEAGRRDARVRVVRVPGGFAYVER